MPKKTAITFADVLAVLQSVADQMHAAESMGHAAEDRLQAARIAGNRKAFRKARTEALRVDAELDEIDATYKTIANLFGSMVFDRFPEPINPSLPQQRVLTLPGNRVAIIERMPQGDTEPPASDGEGFWVELTPSVELPE